MTNGDGPRHESSLGPWDPLGIDEAAVVFGAAPFRWWIGGGRALELHLGRRWRAHDDTDVGMCRRDVSALRSVLAGWDIHVAAAGRLTPWTGEELSAARSENNLWCRRRAGDAWQLDVTLGDGDDEQWIYRRDPRVRVQWAQAVRRTAAGVPYLAPHLQLLFKSKDPRAKDDVDAAVVIPGLDESEARWLAHHLRPGHPWTSLFA
jgi:hypothetical protein